VETGEPIKILAATDERIWKVSVSPDEKFIALGDWNGKVEILEAENFQPVKSWKEESRVLALAFGRDYLLVGRKDGSIEVVKIVRTEKLSGDAIEDISSNPGDSVVGVTTFDRNMLVYTVGGYLKIWNSAGEKVFSARVNGNLSDVENLREPNINITVLPDTYIVNKGNYFFGGRGWSNYVEILKGTEIIKEKEEFLKEITKPELLNEI
jgi:WD40 repeat protein